ncbi:hypothetical protein [Endozoicomonas arenosclerae]|uniref:hypothetical protein n=1 Tax=Endozoicomonas arenosclerae TaxID=1633495 RepID=UPI000783897D|nr:hypothetical protein [Endozoicomonas arenosclerae]
MCSRHFLYKDIICCGSTYQQEVIPNLPEQQKSWEAIAELAQHILDPVVDHFGKVELTYGFCGHKLGLTILKNDLPGIAPKLDQHAGYELNSKGKRICERGGMACDFMVRDTPSSQVALWIVENCPFDRLYFYGDDRPIHVSHSRTLQKEICWMKQTRFGRRQPRRYTVDGFIQHFIPHSIPEE